MQARSAAVMVALKGKMTAGGWGVTKEVGSRMYAFDQNQKLGILSSKGVLQSDETKMSAQISFFQGCSPTS